MLNEEGNDYMLYCLQSIPSSQVRQEMVCSLALIGLRYYIETTKQFQVETNHIRKLYNDSLSYIQNEKLCKRKAEISRQTKSNSNSYFPVSEKDLEKDVERLPVADRNQKEVKFQPNYPNNRHPRPDYMAKYPFNDQTGSVHDALLQTEDQQQNSYLKLGLPAQKRLSLKIYNELKSGNAGIRLPDIPDALEAIGLTLPKELSNDFKGVPITISQSNYDNTYSKDTTIDQDQWQRLIDLIIEAIRDRKLLYTDSYYFLKQLFTKSSQENGSNHKPTSYYTDDELDLGSDSRQSNYSSPATSKASSSSAENSPVAPVVSAERNRPHSNMKSKSKQSPNYAKYKESNTSIARKTQSRIKDQIQRDRVRYRNNEMKLRQAAVGTIARHRVDEYLERDSGRMIQQQNNRDPHDYSEELVVEHKIKPKLSNISLTSGAGALEIAEAFLNSSIGREFAHRQVFHHGSGDDVEIHPNMEPSSRFPRSLPPPAFANVTNAVQGAVPSPSQRHVVSNKQHITNSVFSPIDLISSDSSSSPSSNSTSTMTLPAGLSSGDSSSVKRTGWTADYSKLHSYNISELNSINPSRIFKPADLDTTGTSSDMELFRPMTLSGHM